MSQVIVTFVLEKAEIAKLSTITPTLTISSTVENVAKLSPFEIAEIVDQHIATLIAKAQTLKEVA